MPVIIAGVSDVHSGLEAGTTYYANTSGNLTPYATGWKVGLALSPTEILLDLE